MTPEQAAELKRLAEEYVDDAIYMENPERDSGVSICNYEASQKAFWAYIDSLTQPAPEATFQNRVAPWMQECFGTEISSDKVERNHRFLEEALELVQATGCSQGEAHQLVDYVYGRAIGDPPQEVGGVMVTLAALCLANDLDMHSAGEVELARIWTKVEQIRAKQATKPRNSPLPALTQPAPELTDGELGDAIFSAVASMPMNLAAYPSRLYVARAVIAADRSKRGTV